MTMMSMTKPGLWCLEEALERMGLEEPAGTDAPAPLPQPGRDALRRALIPVLIPVLILLILASPLY